VAPKRGEIPARPRRASAYLLVIVLAIAIGATTCAAPAAADVLFDAARGTPPSSQGFLFLTDPLLTALASEAMVGSHVVLDSTPDTAEKAGWFASFPPFRFRHPDLPVLDRGEGYAVAFDVRVEREDHVSDDRAGFSVIVLSEDVLGVELAFWQDEIWAQSDAPLFTHGESAAHDTTAALTRYTLEVDGTDYALSTDGAPLLAGSLRDYSSFGPPYDFPSFLFVGDDTSSGDTRSELSLVAICAGPPPPGPRPDQVLRLRRNGSELVFEIDPISGAGSYVVFRDDSAASAGTTLHLVSATPVLTDAASLLDGRDEYFVIETRDDCGRAMP